MDILKFWDAVLDQRADELRAFFHPDAQIRWHCTNEIFTVDEFVRANCEYPGDWLGDVERVDQLGDQIITATHVHAKDGSLSCHVVSFISLRDGRILSLDEYWGDDGPAPQWRQTMRIGQRIK